MGAKKKIQVFVSSTYSDLRIERQAAVEAILKAGHIPAGMELFAAGNDSQLDTIRRWIDQSDVLMLILGGRYGSVDPKTSLSYTELEYAYAVAQDIPVFAVVITNEALNAKVKKEGMGVVESDRPNEFKQFRENVLGRISSFFSDSKDIKLAVHETLADFLDRYEFTGWVSGAEVANSTALLEELARAQKQVKQLESELAKSSNGKESETKPSKKVAGGDDGFSELVEMLEAIKITSKSLNSSDPTRQYSVLDLMNHFRDTLITGVKNQTGMTDVAQLLFFNLLPKLEIHGLAATEKVAGVRWMRYRLTPKGLRFLAYIDREQLFTTPSGSENAG